MPPLTREETVKALQFAESAIALKPTIPVDVEAVRAALHYLTAQARVIEKLKASCADDVSVANDIIDGKVADEWATKDEWTYYRNGVIAAMEYLDELLAEEGL